MPLCQEIPMLSHQRVIQAGAYSMPRANLGVCPRCNKTIGDNVGNNVKFCPYCGQPVSS